MSGKTKEELQNEIADLQYALDQSKEKLVEAGIEKRSTLMSKIEEREAEALKTINFIMNECKKETGRAFPWRLVSLNGSNIRKMTGIYDYCMKDTSATLGSTIG